MQKKKMKRLLICLFAMAACSDGPARPEPPKDGGITLQKAIAAFNDANFDEAERLSRAAVAADAKDAVALRLLGRLLALRNRTGEAAAAYAKAVNLSLDPRRGYTDGASIEELAWVCYRMDEYAQAANWFGVLKDSILEKKYRTMSEGKSPYTCRWSDTAATFRITMLQGLPTVEWSVNGQVGTFGIDTGGGELALDPAFARKTLTQVIGLRRDLRGASVEHAIVTMIDAGRLSIRHVPAVIANLQRKGGPALDGMIGANFLAHFAATVDFAGGRLTLRPSGQAPAGRGKEAVMYFAGDRYVLVEASAVIVRDGKETPQRILLQINTARPNSVFVPSESFVRTLAGATVKSVTVAGLDQPPGKLDSTLFPQGLDFAFGFPIAGLAGPEFFRGRTVTLDFEAMKLRVD